MQSPIPFPWLSRPQFPTLPRRGWPCLIEAFFPEFLRSRSPTLPFAPLNPLFLSIMTGRADHHFSLSPPVFPSEQFPSLGLSFEQGSRHISSPTFVLPTKKCPLFHRSQQFCFLQGFSHRECHPGHQTFSLGPQILSFILFVSPLLLRSSSTYWPFPPS